MQKKTLQQIHEAYVEATKASSINALEVEENLSRILDTNQYLADDLQAMDYFIDKLEKSIRARKMTFQSTNVCVEILHTTMYIVAWVNKQFGMEIDTNITARRKSLESELTKALDLADHLVPTQVKDRFGIRFVLLNGENGIRLSTFLATKILNVLCSIKRSDRSDFLEYIKQFDDYTQERIRKLLQLPFTLENLSRHDTKPFVPEKYPDVELPTEEDRSMVEAFKGCIKFYYDPKWNGYQSIHFILSIDNTSEIMPGLQVELQFRTWKMHQFAENDINASHDAHKGNVANYAKVFTLSEEELNNTGIRAFNSYKDVENDLDGIHFPKVFYNRRMNNISL
ncbi:MAG: hypothetical protein J6A36_02530 [Clostridia bacterium]|nr:hypothetical protein [Clostridia bacterium]